MHSQRGHLEANGGAAATYPLTAIAIDKDKGSQNALKWAIDNLVTKGQTLVLVHVMTKPCGTALQEDDAGFMQPTDPQIKEIFLPFRCFCTRKDIHSKDVVLEDTDVAKAVVEFVSQAGIEKLVVGASAKGGFVRRFKSTDLSSSISKGAPDFCSVYVISKGKVSSMRNSVRAAPAISPLRAQIQNEASSKPPETSNQHYLLGPRVQSEASLEARSLHEDSIKSPFSRGMRGCTIKSYADFSMTDSDISFVSSGRPSIDRAFTPRLSSGSEGFDHSFETPLSSDSFTIGNGFSSISQSSIGSTWSSHNMDDMEAEMNRLRLELKQTMDMYSTACKEALTAKQKAMELHRWKMGEERRLEEFRMAEEAAMALAEREKAKARAALEQAEASQRIAELEAQKRIDAEMKALKEADERKRALDASPHRDLRYRKYTIEEIEVATEYFAEHRKIGEGGYGPVYKCFLDHTPVAVKILRPDAAQGRSQFQQEVCT